MRCGHGERSDHKERSDHGKRNNQGEICDQGEEVTKEREVTIEREVTTERDMNNLSIYKLLWKHDKSGIDKRLKIKLKYEKQSFIILPENSFEDFSHFLLHFFYFKHILFSSNLQVTLKIVLTLKIGKILHLYINLACLSVCIQ